MKCDEVRRLVDAWFDGELDAVRQSDIERHVEACPACDGVYGGRRALRAAVRAPGVRYEPPAGLQQRVRDAVRTASPGPRPGRLSMATWLGLAAAAAVIVAGAWAVTLLRPRPSLDPVVQEVVAAHVRSLLPGHLADVPSSDQHAVKPWFAGKVDFSPPVPNLDAQGFLLAGGRLDYVNGHTVAAIVYRRRLHVLNVFLWPSNQTAQIRQAGPEHGYNARHWSGAGVECWVVSDVNGKELDEFVTLFRAAAQGLPR